MKHSKRRALLVVAGICMVALVLAPTMGVAAEFKYDKGPSFTVTYPDSWTQDPENPNNVLWRTKEAGSIPIMEINARDIPEGMTLDKINKKDYKKRVENSQQTVCMVTSDEDCKTKDGTPAKKTVLSWQYQGWMPLQSCIISTFKDNQWVYVVIHQAPGDCLWDAPNSLTFK
jgi:hypothetical protein